VPIPFLWVESTSLACLPPYLQLAFPAVLLQKSGLSHQVISQLWVGNQHKMGPSGICSLLFEMHTLLGDAPLRLMSPPIFLCHLSIFLLIVASPRWSALAALIPESNDHVM